MRVGWIGPAARATGAERPVGQRKPRPAPSATTKRRGFNMDPDIAGDGENRPKAARSPVLPVSEAHGEGNHAKHGGGALRSQQGPPPPFPLAPPPPPPPPGGGGGGGHQ